jgi:2-oxoglutarate ferredoxin oxidoreductase subunit gamma
MISPGENSRSSDLSSPPPIGSGPAPPRSGLLADRAFMEVRFGGTGEQGVILVGVLLAMAATRDHRYVVQTQTYGLDTHEGYGHSDVVISDSPIDYPELQSADLLVALSQDSADGYAHLLRPDSILVYDSEEVTTPPQSAAMSFGIPFTRLAMEENGASEITPNVFTLGAVVGITGVVSADSLKRAVMSTVTPGNEEANRKALARGLALDPDEWKRSGACS